MPIIFHKIHIFTDISINNIKHTILTNKEKINRITGSIEQNAKNLATTGTLFYNMNKKTKFPQINTLIKQNLKDICKNFPIAIGGGLWYDAYKFSKNKKFYGPYAYWNNDKVIFTLDYSTKKYNYLNQDWYKLALPTKWDRKQKRDKEFYWTTPYFDEGTGEIMVTVSTFIYDNNKKRLQKNKAFLF